MHEHARDVAAESHFTGDRGYVRFLFLRAVCSPLGTAGAHGVGSGVYCFFLHPGGSWRRRISETAAIALLAFVMGGGASIPWILDLDVLRGTGDLKRARESRSITVQSGGRIKTSTYWGRSTSIWSCDLRGDAPKDVLQILRGQKMDGLELVGLDPKDDTAGILNLGAPVLILKDACVTGAQMKDLLGAGRLSVVDDFKWDSVPGPELGLSLPANLHVQGSEGSLAEILKGFKNQQGTGVVQSVGEIHQADWDAICELPAGYDVQLYGGINRNVDFAKNKNHDLSNVMIQAANNLMRKDVVRYLLSETKVRLLMYELASSSPKAYFDLMFFRGSSFGYQDPGVEITNAFYLSPPRPITELMDEIGLVFARGEDGNATGLFAPGCAELAEIAEISSLKRLSLDPSWISSETATFMGAGAIDVAHLAQLKELEELWFGSRFIPLDLNFLAKMKSLKKLQIAAVDRTVTGPVGFDACPTLESVTFFGWPDRKTVLELVQLRRLKEVILVDDGTGGGVLSEDELRKALGDIELVVQQYTDEEKRIPKEFLEFRERRKKELGEELGWLDELLAPLEK